MLNKLTREDFEKHVGERFEIDFGESGKLEGKLDKVERSDAPPASREPFSVLFHCPSSAPQVQGIYQVSHPQMGELGLFLVPVHGDEQGLLHEAVFT